MKDLNRIAQQKNEDVPSCYLRYDSQTNLMIRFGNIASKELNPEIYNYFERVIHWNIPWLFEHKFSSKNETGEREEGTLSIEQWDEINDIVWNVPDCTHCEHHSTTRCLLC